MTKSMTLGVGSTFPAGSMARTASVWLPAASGGVVKGDAQGSNAPPSMLHSKRESGFAG